MEKRLTADLNVVANSNLEIQVLDGDLNIIQKLDDEPNDVGGLTSAELKAKFDESGNIIKKYINETLIPAVLTDDATEESRKQAEAARVAAEQGRVTAEQGRVRAEEARAASETARASAEQARDSAETARSGAESTRQSQEATRQTAEAERNSAETARAQSEQSRSTAETARVNAETARSEAETSRATAESNRAVAEQGRVSEESTRVQNENQRVSAEGARAAAEAAREAAEKARADENTGIVAQATAQANAAAGSAESASASAQTAQSASRNAGTAASTASSAASTASAAAEAASGSASQAQASAAAAAKSAASVDGINKTAQSWAVGGTGTRPGEDTDNAKYWAKQAEAVVDGDFATKTEAQGYVTTHNQSAAAHSDIRKAIANMAETFVVTFSDLKHGSVDDGAQAVLTCTANHTAAEIIQAANAGKIVIGALIQSNEAIYFKLTGNDSSSATFASYSEDIVLYATVEGKSVNIVGFQPTLLTSKVTPSAPGNAAVGTSDLAARADHVHPKEVSADDRATWNGKAAGTHASQHGKDGTDPITPAAIGAASLGADGKVPTSQLPEISSVKTYTATIGTTWAEDSNTGVKTQTVAISGVKASQTAKVDHAYTGAGTSDDYAAFVEAENQYLTYITNGYAETYDGGIKFTIFGDANTVSIPIVVEVS